MLPLLRDFEELLDDLEATLPLARIIHIFEDNKSLLCYKHVV
jgi:hypothetical protein